MLSVEIFDSSSEPRRAIGSFQFFHHPSPPGFNRESSSPLARRIPRVPGGNAVRRSSVGDALSTAFMIMSPDEVEKYCSRNQDVLAMILTEEDGGEEAGIQHFGSWDKFSVTILK
ncbi:hypothetical protein IH824_18505 [candidate division KSB1 bacterium]|nr:hypothetical protein [candidate division KSB1 bacterium]